MKDYPALMMQLFVKIVNQHRVALKLNNSKFAQKCWPELPVRAAGSRWRCIRVKSRHSEKPQNVLLSDAHRMATALNIEISYIMMECTLLLKGIKRKDKESKKLTENNEQKNKPSP